MSMVMFASRCDNCGARSEEYTEWPRCRCCENHICPACRVRGSEQDEDRETGGGEDGPAVSYEVQTVWCQHCLESGEAERGALYLEQCERQKGDDDGVEYGHPRDAREDRL